MALLVNGNGYPNSPSSGLDLTKKSRKRKLSEENPGSLESSSVGDDIDCKEDDEEEDDLKGFISGRVDEERLKAFNLFVRFFVDENMDRMVPISKQPKDKLNAILEACDRQFPEFYERARKRVRTYLKACRRNGRKHGGMPTDTPRTTPSHLTSPTAESILEKALNSEREFQIQMQNLDNSESKSDQTSTATKPEQVKPKKTRTSPANSTHISQQPFANNPTSATTHLPNVFGLTGAANSLGSSGHGNFMPPMPFTNPFFPLSFSSPNAAHNFNNNNVPPAAAVAAISSLSGRKDMSEVLPVEQMDWASFEALFKAQLYHAEKGEAFNMKNTISSFREVANFLKRTADHLEAQLHSQTNCKNNGST